MRKKCFLPLMTIILLQLAFTARVFATDLQQPPAQPVAERTAVQDAESAQPGCRKTPTRETLTKGAEKAEGLWTMYYKDQQLLVDLPSSSLGKDYIVLTSIARGISKGLVLGGMSWGSSESVIWSFRKVGNNIHVLRRNVRFHAKPGTPEERAVKVSYSDSVLYALPVLTETKDGQLVDMTPIFMSDDQEIGRYIGSGSRFAPERSTFAEVKGFPKNVEIEVAAVYSGTMHMDTVSDPRGAQVNVHYSISPLPANGYIPRLADDRVGFFVTALKDFSDQKDDQHFVRYINRWNLEKKDPSARLSPPEQPIVFYIEKTVPVHLRPYVQAGMEEWNKAFEKLGFSHAIVVLQQPDDADWDPEDIRYNTFRWITADAGFAMGPSRVNPLTGQILDADILFDASFLDYWKQDYETFTRQDVAALMGDGPPIFGSPDEHPNNPDRTGETACTLCRGMQQQMGFAAAALAASGAASDGKLPDEFIYQALKQAVMHEVGHTLGLRHNFKGSSWKSLQEIAEISLEDGKATVASVMDYSPANISQDSCVNDARPDLYYTQTIGPYDYWAIEYGYKPIDGDEERELERIAAQGAQKGLDYATDEDARMIDPDPLSNQFDLGSDPLTYARRQMETVDAILPKIVQSTVDKGNGYQRARQAFGMLLGEYCRTAYFVSRVPGGIYMHRDHKGDENARPPFRVVDPAKQREAMQLLAQTVFASPTYDPSLLNHLAVTRWKHWGMQDTMRLDYPIHDAVSAMQNGILGQLLSSLTLSRLQDSELKVPADQDAYTLAEHLGLTLDAVFTELKEPKEGSCDNRNPFITSFRRNLQSMALKRFANLVTSGMGYPDDARTLARMHLGQIENQIDAVLRNEDVKLDDYSRAHLLDMKVRIQQVLDARLQMTSIN